MLATVPILFGWLFTVGSCYAAGALLLRSSGISLFRQELHFFRFIAGSACFSLLVFALTAAHLAYPASFLIAGLLLIVGAALTYSTRQTRPVSLPDFPVLWKWIFASAIVAYGIYYFVHALAPETSPDGSTYHLGIIGRYLRQHSFGRITTDMYANLSAGVDLLFLAAYSIGKHSSAALVEFTFLLSLPWGMLSYSRRLGLPKVGVLGALIVYASPVFGISGSIAYNDAAGAAILFAAFYLLQIWFTSRDPRLIALIGFLAGYCYSAKYTLFLALPCAGFFLLWHLWQARQRLLRPLLIYSVCALLSVAPWLAKNSITVGNPFSPFANRLFPNPFVTIHFEEEYRTLMRTREDLTLKDRLLDHILLGTRTSGFLGPVFLLTPLSLLALRLRPGRDLLLAAAIFLVPASANVETRFLMPMAPFLALALSFALAEVPFAIPVILAFHVFTAWPGVAAAYGDPGAWQLNGFYPAEAFRLVPESETLRKRMPSYEIAEMLERKTMPGARIFSYGNPPEAYTSREILVKYESALGNRIGEVLWSALDPGFAPEQVLRFAFPPKPLARLRVVQTAKHAVDLWRISEFQLFDGQDQIPRAGSWKFGSSVNRWDLGLAFDGNPVTCWSTEEPIRPGMQVELDFGIARPISEVRLRSPVEWSPRLRLEGQQRPGSWELLAAAPERQQVSAGPHLRANAVRELKASGITHLLITGSDFGAADFSTRRQEWGISLVAEVQGTRLYKVL